MILVLDYYAVVSKYHSVFVPFSYYVSLNNAIYLWLKQYTLTLKNALALVHVYGSVLYDNYI